MAKGYEKNKGRNGPTFIMLRHDMMDSPAWRSLTPEAQALWCQIRRRFNVNNNGEIPLSCREASERLNVGKTRAARAFDELQEKGFIGVGQDSDFRLKLKRARRWIMTHEVCDGKAPTNEWRQWVGKKPDAVS